MPLTLVAVIPVYNEQDCIHLVVDAWYSFFNKFFNSNQSFRLLLINDGSKDDTGKILDQLASTYPHIEIIHQKNGGHGNAVLNGYKHAITLNPDWIFQVDSDNQFIPEDFPLLWEKKEQSKFIIGFRKKRYDELNRLIITRILRAMNFLIFRVALIDSNIPYRLIKTTFLSNLLTVLRMDPFAPNILLTVLAKRNGQNLFEIPVTHKERKTGQVSIIQWRLLKVCIRCLKEMLIFSGTVNGKLRELKKVEQ